MKRCAIAVIGLGLAVSAQASDAKLDKPVDKISYTIGWDMGSNFKHQSIDVQPEVLLQGIKDALASKSPALSKKEMAATLLSFQKDLIAKREAKFKQLSEKNSAEGEKFFASNKKKAGVVALANGLQYKIITKGNGASPTDKDSVTVDYTGRFPNGKVFDSSTKPVSFKVTDVIPGWTAALKLMKPGATWEVYVPASLAYGKQGIINGPIGPNQALIFKIHLVSVQKAEKPVKISS